VKFFNHHNLDLDWAGFKLVKDEYSAAYRRTPHPNARITLRVSSNLLDARFDPAFGHGPPDPGQTQSSSLMVAEMVTSLIRIEWFSFCT